MQHEQDCRVVSNEEAGAGHPLKDKEDHTMHFPLWLMKAFLAFWMVTVGVAYVMGTSPVFGLIGIIIVTTSILVRRVIQNAS